MLTRRAFMEGDFVAPSKQDLKIGLQAYDPEDDDDDYDDDDDDYDEDDDDY